MQNKATSQNKATLKLMLSNPVHTLSFGFGSGLSPIAPGTAGSLFAWLIFALLNPYLNFSLWMIIIAVSFIIGVFACGFTAKKMNIADPKAVVWDEVVAIWLILAIISPASIINQFWAFLVFRFFDAIKPFPIRYIDQKVKGGFGIMIDDIAAAIFTLIVLYFCKHFIV